MNIFALRNPFASIALCCIAFATVSRAADRPSMKRMYRGPVALAFLDETLVATANQISSSVSLVNRKSGQVVDEISVGDYPTDIVRIDQSTLAVVCRNSGTVEVLRVDEAKTLSLQRTIELGYLPIAIAIQPKAQADGVAWVTLSASGEVAKLNLCKGVVANRFTVGRLPHYLTTTADGKRLAVGLSGESRIVTHSTETGEFLHDAILSGGINLGRFHVDSSGDHAYLPWMVYRSNPINPSNIRRGWILASRIARVDLSEERYRDAMSLDVPGQAVADPHCVDISDDGKWMVCSSSGTHELLVYQMKDLPLEGAGGPGDLIDQGLERNPNRFFRIEVGGRPMMVKFESGSHRVTVANYLSDEVQVIDLDSKTVSKEISVGPMPPADERLVSRGREIFYDATHSLDQWYSCHSCHQDGGTNSKAMDTLNDGSELTTKTVLPLFDVTQTAPWTWHGWQDDLNASLQNSFVSTMQGRSVSPEDLAALRAFLSSLRRPPNPFRDNASESTEKGKMLFAAAGCNECHSGSKLTDGNIHDVGLGSRDDRYDGFNTPSLLGVHLKPRLLHDGRSKSLRNTLTEWHRPEELGAGLQLTDTELECLIDYLRTL